MPLHPEVVSLLDLMEQSVLRRSRSRAPSRRGPPGGRCCGRRPRTATRSSTSTPAACPPGCTEPAPTCRRAGPARLVPRRRLGARRHRHATTTSAARSPTAPATPCSASATGSPGGPVPGRARRLRRGDEVGARERRDARRRPRAARGRWRFGGRQPGRRRVPRLAPAPIRFQLLVYPVTDARADTPSYDGERRRATSSPRRACSGSSTSTCSGVRGASTTRRVSPILASDETLAAQPAGTRHHRRVRSAARRGRRLRRTAERGRRGDDPRPLRRPDPRLLLDARVPVRRPRRPRRRRRGPHPRPPLSRSRELGATAQRSRRQRRVRRRGRRSSRTSARSGGR